MSTGLRASVTKDSDGRWQARAALTGPYSSPDLVLLAYAPSHAEAMQLAWLHLANLDAELMEAVHASRASRRTRKETA